MSQLLNPFGRWRHRIAARQDNGVRKVKGVRDDSGAFGLSNGKMEFPFAKQRRTGGGPGFGRTIGSSALGKLGHPRDMSGLLGV